MGVLEPSGTKQHLNVMLCFRRSMCLCPCHALSVHACVVSVSVCVPFFLCFAPQLGLPNGVLNFNRSLSHGARPNAFLDVPGARPGDFEAVVKFGPPPGAAAL